MSCVSDTSNFLYAAGFLGQTALDQYNWNKNYAFLISDSELNQKKCL